VAEKTSFAENMAFNAELRRRYELGERAGAAIAEAYRALTVDERERFDG
jgi:hypothetical protein